jgi:mannan endo-1,6-alpha-mannosidase
VSLDIRIANASKPPNNTHPADTGDTTYNDVVVQAISHQAGAKGVESFVPSNQSKTEGNDDQIFWAFAAMDAAELNFPAPTGDDTPSWAAMAQSVFNGQSNRWDDHCGGGLRWQMFAFNNGYNYKNVAANGGLFLLSAKLARYTGNTTFVDSVEKQWEWFSNSVLYQPDNFQVNDGTDIGNNCTKPNTQQWSYNYGFYIAGLAYIYNHVSAAAAARQTPPSLFHPNTN